MNPWSVQGLKGTVVNPWSVQGLKGTVGNPWSVQGLKGTVVNQICHSTKVGSLEITPIVSFIIHWPGRRYNDIRVNTIKINISI